MKTISPWKAVIGFLLAFALLMVASGLVVPASAAKAPDGGPAENKLDVGIYGDINGPGNPINGDPKDTTRFTFHVVYVVTKYTDSGTPIGSKIVRDVGVFYSTQQNAGAFPFTFGPPYHTRYCAGTKVGSLCIGTWINEEGYYDIDHKNVPDGYCPQYPDGQDRRKSGTTTENMKFFTSDACGKLYPYFDGKFGYCIGYPYYHRCYIRIL